MTLQEELERVFVGVGGQSRFFAYGVEAITKIIERERRAAAKEAMKDAILNIERQWPK